MLTSGELEAIRALEAEVVTHDGGRLKLEHAALEKGDVVTALRWEGDRLVGFAGRYPFGSPDEIAGMVAPDRRRQGIGTSLVRELLTGPALLVTPAGSAAGQAFALSFGATQHHSEHHLTLGATPSSAESPRVTVRLATAADNDVVRDLLRRAFDWEPPDDVLHRFGDTTRVIELDGVAVGTLRVSTQGDVAGVYGFAVDPAHQGKGIGRDVLGRTCRELRAAGIRDVTLEVETQNSHALGLYTSLGFVVDGGEDYWRVSTA